MNFPCTKCGLCCQNISNVKPLSHFDLGNGTCKYFDKDIGCLIYELRPIHCKIDEGYRKFFSDQIPIDIYYQKNAEVCNKLQEKAQLNRKFRIKL